MFTNEATVAFRFLHFYAEKTGRKARVVPSTVSIMFWDSSSFESHSDLAVTRGKSFNASTYTHEIFREHAALHYLLMDNTYCYVPDNEYDRLSTHLDVIEFI